MLTSKLQRNARKCGKKTSEDTNEDDDLMLSKLIICQCSGQNLMKFFIPLLLCLVFIVSVFLVLKKR